MGSSEHCQAADAGPAAPAEEDGASLAPWVMGILVVVVLVAVVVAAGHYTSGSSPSAPTNPYISKVEVSGLHMATAEKFSGGTVTYIEGRMTKPGDRRDTGAGIEIPFKESIGQIAQKDALP